MKCRKKYQATDDSHETSYPMISLIVNALTQSNYSWISAQRKVSSEYIVLFWKNDAEDSPTLACCYKADAPCLQFSCLARTETGDNADFSLMFSSQMPKSKIVEDTVEDYIYCVTRSIKPDADIHLCDHASDVDRYLHLNDYRIIERRIRVTGFGQK